MIRDHMTYIVVCRSVRLGDYIAERAIEDCDRATTIKDIAADQFEDVMHVLECNPVEGTCRDVSEDIARDVMVLWADAGEPLSDWQRDFIEQFVGMDAAAAFRRAA